MSIERAGGSPDRSELARLDSRAELSSLDAGALQMWAQRVPFKPRTMIFLGLTVAALGVVGSVISSGLAAMVLANAAVSLGTGTVVLGLYKRFARVATRVPSANTAVLDERARRIRGVMARRVGEWSFEALSSELRWTEEALASALLHMKERQEIIEDLNLDTGRWMYRLQDSEVGASRGASLMLEDRLARHHRGNLES